MGIAWLIRQLEEISDRFRTFTVITKLMRQNLLFEQERRRPTEETDLSTAARRTGNRRTSNRCGDFIIVCQEDFQRDCSDDFRVGCDGRLRISVCTESWNGQAK